MIMKIAPFLLAALLVACNKSDAPKAGTPESSADPAAHELKKMTPDEVDQRLAKNDGKFFVFDNNGKDVYDKEHVPSAKWVAFDKVTAADLPADKDATLVFYCMNDH